MKTYIYILLLLITAVDIANAQWTNDPNNPTIVCNATGSQVSVKAINDGNGGYYVFWLDKRAGPTKSHLYGQHYTGSGSTTWTVNGKELWADSLRKVIDFSVIKNVEGNLYFGIVTTTASSGDTILVFKTDSLATPLWQQPVLVAGRSGIILWSNNVQLIEKDSGVFVGYYLTASGNNPKLYINRIDKTGNLLWGFQGLGVPNSGFGGFGMIPDYAGGLLLHWRNSNGLGTGLGVRRITENGTFPWAANVNPAAGTSGLGYDYRAISDDNAGIILTWVEAGGNIMMSRVDSTGALSWSPGIVNVCYDSYSQNNCRIMKNGNYIYVAWLDNRPPNAGNKTYIQQFDMNGNPLWTINGVRCSSINGSGSYTRMVPGDSSSVLFTFDSNVSGNGYYVQKINPDSLPAWAAPGIKLSNITFAPDGDDYALLSTSDSGAISFWSGGGNIYTSIVGTNGIITDLNESSNQKLSITVSPNPATNSIYLRWNNTIEENFSVSIFDVSGRLMLESKIPSSEKKEVQITTADLKSGFYSIVIQSKNERSDIKLVIAH